MNHNETKPLTDADHYWANQSVLKGITPPNNERDRISALVRAIRDLKGACRAEVACCMPWDVAYEITQLSFSLTKPIANPRDLDDDEDYWWRIKNEPR